MYSGGYEDTNPEKCSYSEKKLNLEYILGWSEISIFNEKMYRFVSSQSFTKHLQIKSRISCGMDFKWSLQT